MKLSEIGEIAQQCWAEIPMHFPFVTLDEWVIMPNHVHGIVVITKGDSDGIGNVETRLIASLQNDKIREDVTKDKNPMLAEGLPKIIRWFKGRSSYETTKIHTDFA